MRRLDDSLIKKLAGHTHLDEAMRRIINPGADLLDRFKVSDFVRDQVERDRRWQGLFRPLVLEDQIQSAAKLAHSFALPDRLEQLKTPIDRLVGKLHSLDRFDLLRQPDYMEAFSRTSAFSDALAGSLRVDAEIRNAAQVFAAGTIPPFANLADYRGFLDAAGLHLSRWPRLRLLSMAERRRRFKDKLRTKAEPRHVKQAKSLVHRYELMLREILDAMMAEAYGEDWPEARLPKCDCKNLLGKWRSRGGDVLDHADYAHYAQIMSHPEHFADVFELGFDDREALDGLMRTAGRLRARSHHARDFSPEDLRDLRVTWKTIEAGLIAFTATYDVEDAT
ncbi:hypothetical protein SB2_06630 [Methylobacterium radiotolerans]|nr:hypothetical protein SB3_08670 [Methylobacterium radiotolerans]KTS49230.1 hypothetical protein SB2_06630 [Methylobacterium radiotolerans]